LPDRYHITPLKKHAGDVELHRAACGSDTIEVREGEGDRFRPTVRAPGLLDSFETFVRVDDVVVDDEELKEAVAGDKPDGEVDRARDSLLALERSKPRDLPTISWLERKQGILSKEGTC